MKTEMILMKVYKSSSMVIMPLMLLICLMFKWPLFMIVVTMIVSIVLSSPATILLHLMMRLAQKQTIERSFAWMALLASIPLLSFITAWLFADYVPGKVWFLVLAGMLSGYVGILSHGISVAQLFNSDKNEREGNLTID